MFVFGREFPPKGRRVALDLFGELEAWRSGDAERLSVYYPRYMNHASRTSRLMFRSYTQTTVDIGARFNVAAVITNYMGDLLFGREPRLVVEDDMGVSSGLRDLVEGLGLWSKFQEAAVVSSLYGGVFLCVEWDAVLGEVALVAVPPKNAVPVFWHDCLRGVVFWSELSDMVGDDRGVVWRHFQEHELTSGGPVVTHSLWRGRKDRLGTSFVLGAHPETAAIVGEEVVLLSDGTVTGEGGGDPVGVRVGVPGDRLLVTYVPNRRPSCLGAEGESDLYGVRSAMFRLDQLADSWARDVRLGKTRIAYSADIGGREDRVDRFDLEQELFYRVWAMGSSRDAQLPIEQMKMEIRSEQHLVGVLAVLDEIAGGVGLSSYQLAAKPDSPAETGLALRRRMTRTLETQQTKRRYWEQPVCKVVEDLLVVCRAVGKTVLPVVRPRLVWGPSIEPDLGETAQTLFSLAQGGAVSTRTKVRMLNPGWSDEDIDSETVLIKEELGFGAPTNPTNMGETVPGVRVDSGGNAGNLDVGGVQDS